MLPYFITIVGSFILGSIPWGWIIAKYKGIEIKEQGSGNIGATNVYRVIGKKEGILTLFLDLMKGTIAVVGFSLIFPSINHIKLIAAVTVVLGHDFSLFLLFKGGKGVATTYGATLPIFPLASGTGMFFWIGIFTITKYSSLAALLSFLISTLIALNSTNYLIKLLFLFLFALMLFKHKENIKRLLQKRENRIKI